MLNRVTDKEFCGCIRGVFASTAIDEHGHQFPKSALEEWKEIIEANPQRRIINLGHERENEIGEILDVELIEIDDGHALYGRCGIFEGKEDILKKIDSGKFQDFSIAAEGFMNTTEEEWENIDSNIVVSTPGEEFESVNEIFDRDGIKYRVELQKSVEGLAILSAIAGGIAIANAIKDLWNWYQNLGEERKNNTNVTINIENVYNFDNMSESDLERLIEELEEREE